MPNFHKGGTRFTRLARGLNRERGTMNRNEAAYSEELTADPNVLKWWFEPGSWRLSHPESGQPARYSPDFMVLLEDGTVCFDDVKTAKGFDDFAAGVRIKACAELYPLFRFRLVRKRRKKDGGGFEVTEV